ncbi:MAG: HD domain-containing protein [Helicobacteraceae bacterium]|nr:HD domain-containing protein [Candidatus Sulfurimonas ponti]MBL6973063.1 HD domain-containing protein [Sulfurimonas sp.]
MKKNTIKNITLKRLIQIFAISILSIMLIMFLGYREFFKYTIEDKALEIANLVKAGLTSHMKADIMDKRDYFLNEIKSLENINDIKILRSKFINEQYANSTLRKELDNIDTDTLISLNEPLYEWNDIQGSVRATIPYIANSQENLNCLECHNVKNGDVLGAVTIEMNIEKYQYIILNYSYIFLFILVFFALIIILNVFNFIEKYITEPLSHIVDDGKKAYQFHNTINKDPYETKELDEVAQNINDFNTDVISKEEELQRKNDELSLLNDEIELTLKETMMAMGKIEEIRSLDTKNHTQRVSKLSTLIAKAYGLNKEDVNLIGLTSPLHDIGKIGIGDAILLKPEKLSEDEFNIMKEHATLGYEVLKHSDRLVLKTAATIAYSHHEKYDGTGYPQGIKGDEIPLFARIVAIVDVLDALLSKRVYKEQWALKDVKEFLLQESGKHFEPKLVSVVLENLEEYAQLIDELT